MIFQPENCFAWNLRVSPQEKFKSGNLMEARDYYREAIIYVEDLVDARRKERNELLMPLYANLAQACLLGISWNHVGFEGT